MPLLETVKRIAQKNKSKNNGKIEGKEMKPIEKMGEKVGEKLKEALPKESPYKEGFSPKELIKDVGESAIRDRYEQKLLEEDEIRAKERAINQENARISAAIDNEDYQKAQKKMRENENEFKKMSEEKIAEEKKKKYKYVPTGKPGEVKMIEDK
jgi:hypothetical protein